MSHSKIDKFKIDSFVWVRPKKVETLKPIRTLPLLDPIPTLISSYHISHITLSHTINKENYSIQKSSLLAPATQLTTTIDHGPSYSFHLIVICDCVCFKQQSYLTTLLVPSVDCLECCCHNNNNGWENRVWLRHQGCFQEVLVWILHNDNVVVHVVMAVRSSFHSLRGFA